MGSTSMEGQHRVGIVIEVPQVLRDLGADPAKVLPAAGIDAVVLRNPENAISFVALDRLLQACVAATGCQHFGLLVVQRATTDHFGLVGRLMRNAATRCWTCAPISSASQAAPCRTW